MQIKINVFAQIFDDCLETKTDFVYFPQIYDLLYVYRHLSAGHINPIIIKKQNTSRKRLIIIY